MTHLWIRSESRPNEERVGLTPEGVKALRTKGIAVTVEESPHRVLPLEEFNSRFRMVRSRSWRSHRSSRVWGVSSASLRRRSASR
ncbi:hypothetical protein [Salipiger bermudensis]|uniref:hypothetical protein n=1 Tax=Salipiger bermudensis TaxID=344736 RepID=UPI0035147CAF